MNIILKRYKINKVIKSNKKEKIDINKERGNNENNKTRLWYNEYLSKTQKE